MKHDNSGGCGHCKEIMNKYPGIDEDLRQWFSEKQLKFPNFHIAEAGRGRDAQEDDFNHGRSHAHYGQSAHNFNCALDTFFVIDGVYSLDEVQFKLVTADLPSYIEWYGAPHAQFYERPHFEKRGWRELAAAGLLWLVEA